MRELEPVVIIAVISSGPQAPCEVGEVERGKRVSLGGTVIVLLLVVIGFPISIVLVTVTAI